MLAAAIALPAFGYSAWLAPVLVLLPWYAAELAFARGVGWYGSWRMPLALLIRDIVFPGVWAYAFVARDEDQDGRGGRAERRAGPDVPCNDEK